VVLVRQVPGAVGLADADADANPAVGLADTDANLPVVRAARRMVVGK
jgi:hypothetical protein